MEYSHIPDLSSTGKLPTNWVPSVKGLSRRTSMAKNQTANLSIAETTEKGSSRSMWELLLQVRVLLPYLARLIPLLDGQLVKSSPDLRALQQSLTEVRTVNRDLEVQARNQALQMERIEAQMARMRVAHEHAADESHQLYDEMRALRRSLLAMGVLMIVLLLITAGLVSFLLIHP